MAINPKAIEYITTLPANIIIAEGDRLTNNPFFAAAKNCSDFTIIHLATRPATARERARLRSLHHNTPQQSESWWKGRYTKIDNILIGRRHIILNGDNTPDRIATQLAEIIATRTTRL